MEFAPLFITLFQFYLIFTVFILLLDNREPSETFAWIFVFTLMPGFGFGLYLLVGRNWSRTYDKKSKLPQFLSKNLVTLFKPLMDVQDEKMSFVKDKMTSYVDDLISLLSLNSQALLTTRNQVDIYFNGKDKFDHLLEDLKNAKEYIHMEYFIWTSDDALGRSLKEILIEKVKQGVVVRILYDYSGCFFPLKRKYVKSMRDAGIKMYPFFNYLSPFKLHTFNYRNHRKIAIIDGDIGYTGGMNVGQEHIDGGKRFESWRDTHLRMEGESVAILQAVFAIDWYNTTSEEDVFEEKYFSNILEIKKEQTHLPMQLTTSGYDSKWPAILHLYFGLITLAQENIYISSPYFIPDYSLLTALKTAALRGIEVKLLLTGIPDNRLPYWAAFSYFEELLKAGVKIYHYKKGFMHAKSLSCDGKVCTVGTANFDIRSFRLNYEINAVMYDQEKTAQVDGQFVRDLEDSKELLLSDLNQTSLVARLRNSFFRLFSSLM